MITVSIDVTQLDKTRFKRVIRQNGAEAVFCELVLWETPGGQFGDYLVKQSITKEEAAAKKQMPILGNGKIRGKGGAQAPQAPPAATEDDSVPF